LQEGPALAIADNGDGIDDVFIGGAKGSAGKIYVNKGNDSFAPIKQFDLDSDANYEDTAASFLMLIMTVT
jgi:hypothetical protein